MGLLKAIFEGGSHGKEPEILTSRFRCPCCGFPTLAESAAFEICELCNWEDDGQSDEDADEVLGGPNSDYTLTEARCNFAKLRVMYEPGRDMRCTGGDSLLEKQTKKKLMEAFNHLESRMGDSAALQKEIKQLEEILQGETTRKVREYENLQAEKN